MFLQFGACSDSVTPKYATAENSFFLNEMILWNYLDTSSMLSPSYHNNKNFNMDSEYADYFLLSPQLQKNGPSPDFVAESTQHKVTFSAECCK